MYNFKDIVGNANTLNLIKRSLLTNNYPRFSILAGHNGTGKSTTAITVALYLNCQNPKAEGACLECSSCKAILNSLNTEKKTLNFSKINIPSLKDDDFRTLTKDIFSLASGKSVYIFEEAHAFYDKRSQNILLELLDSLSTDSYIIMTTTEPNKILKELRSRAMQFNFTRISEIESELLINKLALEMHIKIPNNITKLIIKGGKGVPRDIKKLLEFVVNNSVTEEELLQYLNVVKDQDFIDLFTELSLDDFMRGMNRLEDLLKNNDKSSFINSLKSFMLNVVFVIEGDIKDIFTKEQTETLKVSFNKDNIYKIAFVIEKINYYTSENDIKFAFLHIKQLLKGKELKDIIKDNKREVLQQTNIAKNNVDIKKDIQTSNVGLTKIDVLDYLDTF